MAGKLQQVKKPKKRGKQEGKEEEERESRGGRQAGKQFCTGLRPPSCQEEVQHFQEGAPSPPGSDLRRFTLAPL